MVSKEVMYMAMPRLEEETEAVTITVISLLADQALTRSKEMYLLGASQDSSTCTDKQQQVIDRVGVRLPSKAKSSSKVQKLDITRKKKRNQ